MKKELFLSRIKRHFVLFFLFISTVSAPALLWAQDGTLSGQIAAANGDLLGGVCLEVRVDS